MHIPIDLLHTFMVVAETRNFTKAGKHIHRSQSAVSMQIKRLTEIVGKPLIEMEGKQIYLSPMGELVLEHARKILKAHDAAMTAIHHSELKGRVRLGAPEDYCSLYVPQILAGFALDYPDIRVDVICRPSADLYRDLLQEKLDLAICTALDIDGEKIFQEPVVWVVGNNPAVLEQDSLPLAVYSHNCLYRKWATQALDKICRPFHVAYMSPSISGILAAVRSGLAIAPMGLSVAGQDTRVVGPEYGFPALPVADVCLHGIGDSKNPLVNNLATHVRESFYARKKRGAGLPA
ncbi:LysR substrate-binding domain-containing protein [Desulfospira joergensenii]|uniref:LysR substrate-binding domain-containing protein n=1 Tax=Desulfospira joergensenii TaxID=53329 RepID=UPI0003B77166|nr:LysR family transcriptional regulator [Desulfospira joergensenii]